VSAAKHTPGPWGWDYSVSVKAGDSLVALVYSTTQQSNLADNARLIAAAPTTAEKAMAFTFIVESFMRGDLPQGVKAATETEVADALYELRNHIAKATGSAS
jgi:hypothetical protein